PGARAGAGDRRRRPRPQPARPAPAASGGAAMPAGIRPATPALGDPAEMWRRDPYAIYARHILRLRPLNELDADPSRADLGNAVHDALAAFVRDNPQDLPAEAQRELRAAGEAAFAAWLSRPSVWAFWWP